MSIAGSSRPVVCIAIWLALNSQMSLASPAFSSETKLSTTTVSTHSYTRINESTAGEVRALQQSSATSVAASPSSAEIHIDWNGRITAWSTTLLAVSTVFLAWFTLRLWVATRTVVESAERTAKQELRAYVFVQRAEVESLQPTMVPVPRISIKNSGKMPAYNVRVFLVTRIANSCSEAVIDPDLASVVGHLAPHGELSLTCKCLEPLSPDKFEALIDRRSRMFVFGIVHYLDAFSHAHFTRFRLELSTPVVLGTNDMIYCEAGNDTDDLNV